MSETKKQPNRVASVRRFFAAYEKAFNQALESPRSFDPRSLANAFAKRFVGANPNGVQAGKNGLVFRMMLRRHLAQYLRAGLTALKCASLKVTPMDAHHALVKVHWVARTQKADGSATTSAFDNFYALQWLAGRTPKIFAFVETRGLTESPL